MYTHPKCIEYDKFKTAEAEELENSGYILSEERAKYYFEKENELLSQMSNEELQELIDTPNLPSQAKAYYTQFIKD